MTLVKVSTRRLRRALPHSALTLAIAGAIGLASLAGAPLAHAQSTTGTIFGTAPVASGESVVISNASTGVTRTVSVGKDGRYSASSLPLGSYTVTLMQNGTTVQTQKNIQLTVGAGSNVSFTGPSSANAQGLSQVTVSASAMPPIDVSGFDSRTVVTSQQLAKLPLQRSAEAVAQLAPGVNAGSGYFTGPTGSPLVSFGGSSIAENAYYINGFNTTDPLHNFGGLTLPYGAIDQEQVLTGGYGAKYGRSDGGVLNMVGKRGTNTWHFGGQLLWQPDFARADERNTYYPTGPEYGTGANSRQGQIYQYRKDNNKGTTGTADAYFGGPLIKDKLFIFGAVEAERRFSNTYNGAVDNQTGTIAQTQTRSHYTNPKWYGKIDWNINDNNILELTGVSNKHEYSGNNYAYTYQPGSDKGVAGAYLGGDTHVKQSTDMWSAHYTGYITDSLTVEALYGEMTQRNYQVTPGYNPDAVYIANAGAENPAYTGGRTIVGNQTIASLQNPNEHDTTQNYRLDINYKIGNHSITAGIDNLNTHAYDIGQNYSGPGQYIWNYGQSTDPSAPISTLRGSEVGAPGGEGYYVSKVIYTNAASARVAQRAQYIEDQWQVSDRVLLSLGLRDDQFTNYNPDGVPYLRLTKPQWSPRVAATWDVNGDSSFKIYGSAGRYYIDEPANVAIRGAAASTYTNQYFTYTGIDPTTGVPTGLTQIPQGHYPGVSANNEYGVPPDPKTVTSKNAKAEYQDEYILGFDKTLGHAWVYGAKAMYRNLRNDLDDVCDDTVIEDAASAQGIDPQAALGSTGCYIMNPGRDAKINVSNGNGGYQVLNIPWSAWGMPKLKRKYYSLEMYLEHPFDGTWYGKVDYVFSRSYGNTEGSVRSDIGQTDVSQTEDWDNKAVMSYANGPQSNDRTHVLKAYGYYQLTPQFLLGANLLVESGTPKTCLGYYGPTGTDPYGYNNNPPNDAYHWCNGQPSPPGAVGRTPWQEIVSVDGTYTPKWGDGKLQFTAQIFNLFNQQRPTQYLNGYSNGAGVGGPAAPTYMIPVSYETPRYVQLGVNYNF
ncbi:TonB-dependent receptor [Oleiagrimonas sp. C23AA]|uniref:TonB-dependent receptor n=1 Tax=Oleiagrimonas sp. C23AA TaxID=2719047 RepID=UPI00141E0B05|nr:TonB-dependent receptor [Oleiagrimonas sp. C23AA]NII09302.1 TonB-dependent receptor [Oleiagrimonas sp. C23AA]